jgi:hypothetical protein
MNIVDKLYYKSFHELEKLIHEKALKIMRRRNFVRFVIGNGCYVFTRASGEYVYIASPESTPKYLHTFARFLDRYEERYKLSLIYIEVRL